MSHDQHYSCDAIISATDHSPQTSHLSGAALPAVLLREGCWNPYRTPLRTLPGRLDVQKSARSEPTLAPYNWHKHSPLDCCLCAALCDLLAIEIVGLLGWATFKRHMQPRAESVAPAAKITDEPRMQNRAAPDGSYRLRIEHNAQETASSARVLADRMASHTATVTTSRRRALGVAVTTYGALHRSGTTGSREPGSSVLESPQPATTSHAYSTTDRILGAIERVIEGKTEVIRLALAVMLAEGHLLIEDVPGVGKTTLAKTLARTVDCSTQRIQFTPDLLPSDVTGTSVYHQDTHSFEFKPGPVFANIVIGDEINRASPKTQSALLECMEERQVTADGVTHVLETPFMVIATQNPIELEGTYPLPEAQRDRFTARLTMGYPSASAELAMLSHHAEIDPLETVTPVTSGGELRSIIATVRKTYVAAEIKQYVLELVSATRDHSDIRLGASPRASLRLIATCRALAALDGRDYVIPEDVHQLAVPVLAHRIVLSPAARLSEQDASHIIAALVDATSTPRGQLGDARGH